MSRKLVLTLVLTLLVGTFNVAFNIQRVKAIGPIYIRADGSIEPSAAQISTFDNVTYTFTGNINDSIVIERDNIVVDGVGYILRGPGNGNGIDLSSRSNVTSKNTNIKDFSYGILLSGSSNINITGNSVTNNSGIGIGLDSSSNNSMSGNHITNNSGIGIELTGLSGSSNNSIIGNVLVNDGLRVWNSFGNVVVDNLVNGKPLVYLEGASDVVVEDAGQVILVDCNSIRVENLNLSNTNTGVQLWQTTNATISGNDIANNGYGIELESSSNHNNIIGNHITNSSEYGIQLISSSDNSVSGNNITNNGYGIYLVSSSNSSVGGNNVTNNSIGIELISSSNNSLSGNNISNNNNGMMLSDSSSTSISGNNITTNGNQGLVLDGCSNMSVSGNNITANHYEGISLSGNSFNNSISGNNITDNMNGIAFTESFNNSIFDNNITNNKCGVVNWANNIFYHNNFLNNGVPPFLGQVLSFGMVNVWDDGYPSGGNYWSDYAGVDSNHDGIGDTPYVIDANNTDHYPLMVPYVIPEFPSILVLPLFMMVTLPTVIVYRRRMEKGN